MFPLWIRSPNYDHKELSSQHLQRPSKLTFKCIHPGLKVAETEISKVEAGLIMH